MAAGSTLRNVPSGVSNVDDAVGREQPVRRLVGTERQELRVLEIALHVAVTRLRPHTGGVAKNVGW